MATAQTSPPQSLASREPEYLTEPLANDLLDLLSEAAVAIRNSEDEGNPVHARLRAMIPRVEQASLEGRR